MGNKSIQIEITSLVNGVMVAINFSAWQVDGSTPTYHNFLNFLSYPISYKMKKFGCHKLCNYLTLVEWWRVKLGDDSFGVQNS